MGQNGNGPKWTGTVLTSVPSNLRLYIATLCSRAPVLNSALDGQMYGELITLYDVSQMHDNCFNLSICHKFSEFYIQVIKLM